MTATPRRASAPRAGLLASVLARAESWLLEPVDEVAGEAWSAPRSRHAAPLAEPPLEPPLRRVIAVVGLAPRCGATTVARAMGAELAARDSAGAAIVSTGRLPATAALHTPSARRLARSLISLGLGPVRACGRLCLVPDASEQAVAAGARRLAPIVLDAGYGTPPAAAAALADRVVLVATPSVPPALGEVVATSLAGGEREPPVVVLNRTTPDLEETRAEVLLPEARAGAQLAVMGCQPAGAFGAALAELADRIDAPL